MNKIKLTYQGDENLAELLTASGASTSLRDVKELLAGIAAAPRPLDDGEWLRLVVPAAEGPLRAQLVALRETLAAMDDGIGQSGASPARLADLRAAFRRQGLDGFVVPLADEHQGEYVARRSRRLAWLTGFTGSAGLALLLVEKAALFTDGRYTLQIENQTDGALYERHHITESPPYNWIEANLSAGMKMGFDPWLHSADQRRRLSEACARAGAELKPCDSNPLDEVWHAQPPRPVGAIVPQDIQFSGRESAEKRREIAGQVKQAGAAAAFLSAPDSIAWLLNVRGADVECAPLPQSFVLLQADGRVQWFVDPRKQVAELTAHLGDEITTASPEALGTALDSFGAADKSVMLDPATAPDWAVQRLCGAGAAIIKKPDPCALPKACKNAVELNGIRAAHLRDGLALTRFLCWLSGLDGSEEVTELMAVAKLAAFRAGGAHYRGPSFDTISGAAANGAIVHYRVTPESDRALQAGSLYLVDSGGQYLDGTTDVTRTVAIGAPTAEYRDRFTRVLKGHIALARARFPVGTTGAQLDSLARQFLWQAGLDYDHGTGHGVGAYLNVHEGPQRISKHPTPAALEPGMIVSNEPGYYKAGAFGIRIENLVTVIAATGLEGAERPTLAFETLTLAPIDRALVDLVLMNDEELDWLDAYHAMVRARLAPELAPWPDVVEWLTGAAAPLNRAPA
ncbi:MAG: M24 family metallopeptidase [Proteobacteria bacterium]|nr:M24 family metallopeptidase [Pseudomonadota bacterium]MDA1356603.1 M24 family metallopeptidase [Pseudomonadota bacterium]